MEVDRRAFIATVGAGALSAMSPEDKAEELEHYMIDMLDGGHDHDAEEPLSEEEQEVQEVRNARGMGRIFQPRSKPLEPMPANATLEDFFRLRFAPANHVLQSASHAMQTGQPERTILACLLHDTVQTLVRADHGYWGAQLFEPYVDERVTWGIKYHQALRFFPDESVGYEYPEMYNRIFGEDYVPEPYIYEAYEYARAHKYYMESRMITVNDTYAFQEGLAVDIDPFIDIIGRNFKSPKEGLGNDNSGSAHMWRTLANPERPL